LLALKQRLEEENGVMHQQLKDVNTKEKRHLQLIQDLEQGLRYNAKHHSESGLSEYSTIRYIDGSLHRGVAANRISD
jgi:hypothetical protein